MDPKPKIKLSAGVHREQNVIKIEFAYNRKITDLLKKETKARWSDYSGFWYIPENNFVLGDFFTAIKPVAYIYYSALKK